MRETCSMIVVLSLVCSLSALLLATVKQATRTRIEEQVLTHLQGPAIRGVLHEFDNDPIADRKFFKLPNDKGHVIVFPAIHHGVLQSIALEAAGPGFSGDIGVMVGFDIRDDILTGIGITSMKETPGIGTKVAGPGFVGQFRKHGLEGLTLSPRGGDIDAVSGATISSTGAVRAVNNAVTLYQALKHDIVTAWRKE